MKPKGLDAGRLAKCPHQLITGSKRIPAFRPFSAIGGNLQPTYNLAQEKPRYVVYG